MIAKILICSNLETLKGTINNYLSKIGLKVNHPDLLYFQKGEKLGIEQARKIKEFLSIKPFKAKGSGVVLEDASVLTHEAQNALLKTLEELPEKTLLLLGAENEHTFLPTVLSRCEIVIPNPTKNPDSSSLPDNDIERLLNSTLDQRFEYIEKLKDKEKFLKDLVNYFQQHLLENLDNQFFFGELIESEEWAASNVNIRAILEYLMLIIPSR